MRESHDSSLLRALPGVARSAAGAYVRAARWSVHATRLAGSRLLRAALIEEEPTASEEPAVMTPAAVEAEREEARKSLRERGEELLRLSADVNFDEGSHPAYARILEDLAPDEARILRLLAAHGPQPSVDVRSGLLPLKSTSELVAAGLNMIGPEAGCRHLDDVPAYLNNLFRLGLIWFSSESLPDPLSYQVLEAQPEVGKAMDAAGHTRTVRRSIHLTPFGADFCELCLPGEASQPDGGEDGDRSGGVDSAD
jgi:Abortive infection alpha